MEIEQLRAALKACPSRTYFESDAAFVTAHMLWECENRKRAFAAHMDEVRIAAERSRGGGDD